MFTEKDLVNHLSTLEVDEYHRRQSTILPTGLVISVQAGEGFMCTPEVDLEDMSGYSHFEVSTNAPIEMLERYNNGSYYAQVPLSVLSTLFGSELMRPTWGHILYGLENMVFTDHKGICECVREVLRPFNRSQVDIEEMINLLMKNWEHHSGDPKYPIQVGEVTPHVLYIVAAHQGSMWEGEYGNKRRELHLYCIERARAALLNERTMLGSDDARPLGFFINEGL